MTLVLRQPSPQRPVRRAAGGAGSAPRRAVATTALKQYPISPCEKAISPASPMQPVMRQLPPVCSVFRGLGRKSERRLEDVETRLTKRFRLGFDGIPRQELNLRTRFRKRRGQA